MSGLIGCVWVMSRRIIFSSLPASHFGCWAATARSGPGVRLTSAFACCSALKRSAWIGLSMDDGCGANADEARNRLYNERLFYWDHVSTAWWQWRWYYAASGVGMVREPNRALP